MQRSRFFFSATSIAIVVLTLQIVLACVSAEHLPNQGTSSTNQGTTTIEQTKISTSTLQQMDVTLLKAPIQVSQAVFTKTFSEVEALIAELNTLIRARDYTRWTNFLSPEYTVRMSDAQVLSDLSASPILKRNERVLHSLADYFNYVVVPSRNNIKLNDLVFLSENEVEAIMIRDTKRVTVYRLININGQWKIGL